MGAFKHLDVICARRAPLIYVSPPVCENDFSSTGGPVIVLNPLRRMRAPTGFRVEGFGGGFRFRWDTYPGAICFSIYKAVDANNPNGEFTLVAECVPCCEFECPDCEDGCYRLTVITLDGESDLSDVICTTDAPVANFTGNPLSGFEPLAVDFSDISTGNITNRMWDFGDGDTLETLLTNFMKVYSMAGTYTVSLTVAGPAGNNNLTRVNYITVDSLPPSECGTPAYQINGYNATIAQAIVDLMPMANASALPEWDGIFRNNSGIFTNSPACYSILGKAIALTITQNSVFTDNINCNFMGIPGFWTPSGVGDCNACFETKVFVTFTSDRISVSDGVDSSRAFVNQAAGIVGGYGLYTSPDCSGLFFGEQTYHVTGVVASSTIDPDLFTVSAI